MVHVCPKTSVIPQLPLEFQQIAPKSPWRPKQHEMKYLKLFNKINVNLYKSAELVMIINTDNWKQKPYN